MFRISPSMQEPLLPTSPQQRLGLVCLLHERPESCTTAETKQLDLTLPDKLVATQVTPASQSELGACSLLSCPNCQDLLASSSASSGVTLHDSLFVCALESTRLKCSLVVSHLQWPRGARAFLLLYGKAQRNQFPTRLDSPSPAFRPRLPHARVQGTKEPARRR